MMFTPHPHGVCFISQLKSFGAKLKERNNLFRKMSKIQSHEMKEVLYSNLVQANLVRILKLKYLQHCDLLRVQMVIGFFFPGGATEVERNN